LHNTITDDCLCNGYDYNNDNDDDDDVWWWLSVKDFDRQRHVDNQVCVSTLCTELCLYMLVVDSLDRH